jgi:hypothetical protein
MGCSRCRPSHNVMLMPTMSAVGDLCGKFYNVEDYLFQDCNRRILSIADDENEGEENNVSTTNLDKENADNGNIITEGE